MDWNYLAQVKTKWWVPVNAVMNIRVPQNAWHFLTILGAASLSGRALLQVVS